VPLGSVFPGAEALQGSIHVGGAHATSHRREAPQMHGELARAFAKPQLSCGALHQAELAGCELVHLVYGIEGDVWWEEGGGTARVVRSMVVHGIVGLMVDV